jgi:hypothetical protein
MRLDYHPSKSIENPTKRDIAEYLNKIYAGEGDALVLISNEEKNHFIQVVRFGGHVEYMRNGISYFADDVSLEECHQVFLDYLTRGRLWRTMLPWEVPVKEAPQKQAKLIEVRKTLERKWDPKKVIFSVMAGFAAVILFCILSTSFPMEKMLFPGFMLVLGAIPWLILRTQSQARFTLIEPWKAIIFLTASLLFALAFLSIAITQVGFFTLSTISVVIVSGWAIYTSLTLYRQAVKFREACIEVQCDRHWISMMESLDPDAPASPVLNYVYLNQYHDYKLIRWQSRKIGKAIREEQLKIYVQYLPDDPLIHRVSRIQTD